MRNISALSFKDLTHSIFIHYKAKAVCIFAIYAWLIWYARNKFYHKDSCSTTNQVATHILHIADEYKLLYFQSDASEWSNPLSPKGVLVASWPRIHEGEYSYSFFSEHKIGIRILVRNHLGISFLAKALPRQGHFKHWIMESLLVSLDKVMWVVLPSLVTWLLKVIRS